MRGIAVLREQTKQFIDDNPVDIEITRDTLVDDGAGGRTRQPVTLPAQRVRITFNTARTAGIENRTVAGEVMMPDYQLTAEWDADLRDNDSFTYQGTRCEITIATVVGNYETSALVVRRG